MSLTDNEKGRGASVAFAIILFIALGLIIWSLERFHGETVLLTKTVAQLREESNNNAFRQSEELRGLREAIEKIKGQTFLLRDDSGSRESDPLLPSDEKLRELNAGRSHEAKSNPWDGDKVRPIGGAMVNIGSEPKTWSRYNTSEGSLNRMLNDVHDAMMAVNPEDLSARQSLATSWEVKEGGLVHVFHLRRNVRFSDGAPFSSADVLFTYNLIMDPEVESEAYRDDFMDVEKIWAPDEHTIEVRWTKKFWPGLYRLGLIRVLSKKWCQDEMRRIAKERPGDFPAGSYSLEPGEKGFGPLYNEIDQPSVGTGPYKFDPLRSWDRGKQVTFYRNPGAWIHRVHPGMHNLAAIRYRFIRDDVVLWQEVRKKALDVRVVDADQWYDVFQNEKAITDYFNHLEYSFFGNGTSLIYWNCRRDLFKDKRVRQALAHCIDREGFLRDFLKGITGALATNYFYPWAKDWSKDLKPRTLDLDKARKLMASAGWTDSDGDGILDKDGKSFEFVLSVPSGRDFFIRLGEMMQRDMGKIGIRIEIRPLEWASFISAFYDRDFDAACLYNSHSDPWPDPYLFFHSSQIKKRANNHSGLVDPAIDRLLTEARAEFDEEKRVELHHRLNDLVAEQAPIAWLYFGKVGVLSNKRFKNVRVTPAGLTREKWYVEPADRIYNDDGSPKKRIK